MANKMRHRWGETNAVGALVESNVKVDIGDLLWIDKSENSAKPASLFVTGRTFERRSMFVESFLGVAMQYHLRGISSEIRVATTGIFEFDCMASAFRLGDFIGVLMDYDYASQQGVLCNQRVCKIIMRENAIGKVTRRATIPMDYVNVAIHSSIMSF